MKIEHPRIPVCTYRLQFNRWFTFVQAREIVPYLRKLGVSDVYASPYFQASPESMHGYDITDHNLLNTAIGSREEYDSFVGELRAHKMPQPSTIWLLATNHDMIYAFEDALRLASLP